jgi:Leucine-rich repeat (LRR) protein
MKTMNLSIGKRGKINWLKEILNQKGKIFFFAIISMLFTTANLFAAYSNADVKALQNWDKNCDTFNLLNWNSESDPGRFHGVTWDTSEPKRAIKINISSLNIYGTINLNNLPMLTEFNANSAKLQTLTASNHLKIIKIDVGSNNLTSLDITGCSKLKELYCRNNKLSTLTMNNANSLKTIDCSNNELREIVLPSGATVSNLNISGNRIPFSQMPLTGAVSASYDFSGQLPVFAPSTQWLGYVIDYSSEQTIGSTASTYKWYKNGTLIFGATNPTYKPSSAGAYVCKIKNTKFPGLEIETMPVTIKVSPNDIDGDGYHDGDVAGLNKIRTLSADIQALWQPGQHANWSRVKWNDDYPKRVKELRIYELNLSGELDVSPFSMITILYADVNNLNAINLTGLSNLFHFDIRDNFITELDVSNLSRLNELQCSNNLIQNITFGNNPDLIYIYCEKNHLSNIDVSNLPNLHELSCGQNSLISLNLSGSNIGTLDCSKNVLTSLINLPQNIRDLNCSENQLTELNLEGKGNLWLLNITKNQFSSIDLSHSPDLRYFYCGENFFNFSKLPNPDLLHNESVFAPQYFMNWPTTQFTGYVIDYTSEANIYGVSSTFEWYLNDEQILGENGPTLNTALYGEGQYFGKITNDKFPGVNNYAHSVTITRRDQQILGETSIELKYTPNYIKLNHTASSGLPITYSLINGSCIELRGDSILIVGIGESEIMISQAGNNEYKPTEQTLTINTLKADEPILGIHDIEVSFDKDYFSIDASTPNGFYLNFSSPGEDILITNWSLDNIEILGIGTTEITLTHWGNQFYNGNSVTFNLTITKGNNPIWFSGKQNYKVGEQPQRVSINSKQEFPLTIESTLPSSFYYEEGHLHIGDVGSGELIISHQGNDYYLPYSLTVNITVERGNQTSTSFPDLSGAVGDNEIELPYASNQEIPFEYTSSDSSIVSITGNRLTFKQPGNCIIFVSNGGNNNYTPFGIQFSIIVYEEQKQVQTITNFNDMELTATSDPFNLNASSTSGLPLNYTASNNCIEINGSQAIIRNTGTVLITARQEGNNIFYPVEKTIQVNIHKAEQIITGLGNQTININEGSFMLEGQASSGLGLVFQSSNPEVASIEGNLLTLHTIGTTIITATQEGNWKFLPITIEKTFTVVETQKLSDEINTPDNWEFVYGVQSMKINFTSVSGLKVTAHSSDESVVSIIEQDLIIRKAGECIIYLSTEGNEQYHPSESMFIITIQKANQSINNFEKIELKLGQEPLILDAFASSGDRVEFLIIDESIASLNGNGITPVNIGKTKLIAFQSGNSNYNPVTDTVEVIIVHPNRIVQTIENLNDITAIFGDMSIALPLITSEENEIIYEIENKNIATINRNILNFINAGTTIINATEPGNETTEPLSIKITLTVQKADQSISPIADFEALLEDGSIQLTGEASSGLEITYTSSNPEIASIESSSLILHQPGKVIITASQKGNSNFKSAEEISFIVEIISRTNVGTINGNSIAVYPNPTTGILNLDLDENADIQLFDSQGKIVFFKKIDVQNNKQIDIQHLRKGIYQLLVNGKGIKYRSKVVLK